ncbi:hypothetical protein AN191_10485 [Loktanella sp. 5RATIMAR09]|uniref:hypothetical protein n=1 Tax=Loktanella sp. 5RATIMAR09 TaxID=1225655 RepID=UPI0006EB73E3|nr:hypothetical protein [Loktanella sp. 5RATIMAR09]KQI71871.1 hypothetical protein AN191_10485 [Loktanella sp. 5RATIMAR09]
MQIAIGWQRIAWNLSPALLNTRMEEFQTHLAKARKTGFRVTAYVTARILQRDLHDEVARLETQSRAKSYREMAALLGVLFALAVIAASFGWIGLALYFAAVLLLFY